MAIKKRLTPEQRAKKLITPQHRRALRHPLIRSLCYNNFDPTPIAVLDAIGIVKSWKGATWTQKVLVLALDLIMDKAFGIEVLDPDTYNRLQDHIANNENKMQDASPRVWHTWIWDIYHDGYHLQDMEAGDLELPKLLRPKRKLAKTVATPKKRKLRKLKR